MSTERNRLAEDFLKIIIKDKAAPAPEYKEQWAERMAEHAVLLADALIKRLNAD